MEVGFTFFLILARMQDIDPLMSTSKSDVIFFIIACTLNMSTTLQHFILFFFFNAALQITPDQAKAYEFYKKNSLSIELIKDDVLQKVNFRVKNKV